MLPFLMPPIMAAMTRVPLSFDGTLDKTQGTTPVTSTTRTITGTGTLLFDNIVTDSGSPQYSKNGGAFTNITEGMTLAMSNGDTLAVRVGLLAGESCSFNMKDNDGGPSLIEIVNLVRT